MKENELLKKALLSKDFLTVWFAKLNKPANIYFALNYLEMPSHQEMVYLYDEIVDENGVLYYIYENKVIAKSYLFIEDDCVCLYSIIKVLWFYV
jgi:hypothetical protein